MTSKRARRLTCLVLLGTVGCTKGPPLAAPVEPDKARAALRTALDAWKADRPIGSLDQATPPIVAQDFDWMKGAKLTEYKLLGEGKAEDANLRVPVQLTVRDPQGRTATKTVRTTGQNSEAAYPDPYPFRAGFRRCN